MDSLLARLRRGRTKSQSGSAALAPLPPLSLASAPANPPTPISASSGSDTEATLDRRIHPDLDSLVANWTPGEPAGDVSHTLSTSPAPIQPFSTALRPSTRRHSMDGTPPFAARANTHLEALREVPGLAPSEVKTHETTRITPPPSTSNVVSLPAPAGWSTFGRRDVAGTSTRPHLTDFGGEHSESPAGSRPPSASAPSSRSASVANLSTTGTNEHGTHSHSVHEASDAPLQGSDFTFGPRGRAEVPVPPPMPALDHPAFAQAQPQSLALQRSAVATRSSSSLRGSPHSSSSSQRHFYVAAPEAQDVFALPSPARRRASAESIAGAEGEGALLTLASGEMGVGRDLMSEGEDHDTRRKRVGGSSSDTQVRDPGIPASTMEQKKMGPALPSMTFTAATPSSSTANDSPSLATVAPPHPPSASDRSGIRSGKRKATDIDSGDSPPKAPKATVTLDARPHRPSTTTTSSRVPSPPSHRPKRARVDMPSDATGSIATGTGSTRARSPHQRPQSRQRSRAPSVTSHASSIPISAIVTPHAPSIARSAGGTAYYMRDPRKAPRVQPTGWALALGEGGSPAHAWLFFVGFVLFPVWAVAGFCVPVPRTRRLRGDAGAAGAEKGEVVLDDPQVEFDARSWRRRCRIMAGISLVTYVPFIVLVAVFVPRGR